MSQTNPIFTDEKNNPHASAAGGAAGQSDLASLALEQTQRTVAESGSAEPKRGRGQRGPDKAPRARPGLRVVDLGKAPGASPLAENASMRPEDFLPSVQPSFDPAAAQEIVQGVIGMLNDGAAAWIETVTLKELEDKELASANGEKARMKPFVRSAVEKAAIKMLEEAAVDLRHGTKIIGATALLLWAGGNFVTVKRTRKAGAEKRAKSNP